MGTMGTLVGGALLGIGAGAMTKTPSYKTATEVHSSMTASVPDVPETPTAVDGASGGTNNALMEEAREKELLQAALRRQQAQEVFTSGLGASGMASTDKKSLLGG